MFHSLSLGILQLPPNLSFESSRLIFQSYSMCCSQSDLFKIQFGLSHHSLKTFHVFPAIIRIAHLSDVAPANRSVPSCATFCLLCAHDTLVFFQFLECPGDRHRSLSVSILAKIFSCFLAQLPLSGSDTLTQHFVIPHMRLTTVCIYMWICARHITGTQ